MSPLSGANLRPMSGHLRQLALAISKSCEDFWWRTLSSSTASLIIEKDRGNERCARFF